MSFPRYPAYKDSGVEWLGDMPEHWEARPIKTVAHIENSGFYGEDEDVHPLRVPVATTAQIDRDGRFSVEDMPIRSFTNNERNRYGCRSGDILVVKSSGSATNIISGKAGLVREADPLFIFSNFLMRIQVNRKASTPAFLYYFIISNITKQRVQLMCSSTTYPNLKVGEYISACISLPSVNEQVEIATFLERETAKIDALIAAQQRLIELLQEKRQAVISHAVTKGLNPNASMKDSGVEWLGEVPEHWENARLSRLTTKIGDGLHGTPEYVEESEFYFVNGNNLNAGAIAFSESTRCVCKLEFDKNWLDLNDTTLLMSINGTIGNFALYRGESIMLGKSASYINCNKRIFREYLSWIVQSHEARYYFALYSTGTTISNLGLGAIKSMPVAVPPLNEQARINDLLAYFSARNNRLIYEAELAVGLLQERRSALISAAVTGQIDVRGLVEVGGSEQ